MRIRPIWCVDSPDFLLFRVGALINSLNHTHGCDYAMPKKLITITCPQATLGPAHSQKSGPSNRVLTPHVLIELWLSTILYSWIPGLGHVERPIHYSNRYTARAYLKTNTFNGTLNTKPAFENPGLSSEKGPPWLWPPWKIYVSSLIMMSLQPFLSWIGWTLWCRAQICHICDSPGPNSLQYSTSGSHNQLDKKMSLHHPYCQWQR